MLLRKSGRIIEAKGKGLTPDHSAYIRVTKDLHEMGMGDLSAELKSLFQKFIVQSANQCSQLVMPHGNLLSPPAAQVAGDTPAIEQSPPAPDRPHPDGSGSTLQLDLAGNREHGRGEPHKKLLKRNVTETNGVYALPAAATHVAAGEAAVELSYLSFAGATLSTRFMNPGILREKKILA
ncbi:hypothetical protein ZWY2020_035461 [Hordeum vulgare]|nr:hypothetical protein ZWY2020_035461 [Hordeum vulgare]